MSPIAIFVYKRYETTQRMIDSLLRCAECADSELYLFMDGPADASQSEQILRVRRLFDNLQGFKAIHTFPSSFNKGLARSIIDGVSHVLRTNDRVIVLEDDLVVAPDFLSFMNSALDTFRHRDDIWSISGYTPELTELSSLNPNGTFLVPRAQCWGWATWADRWNTVDWQVSDYNLIAHNRHLQNSFNRGGNDLFPSLRLERSGRIESWAIRWAYAASRQHRFTLNPVQSKVQNIGLDHSATHGGWNDRRHHVTLHGNPTVIDADIQPVPELVSAFKRHHDLSLISRIGYFMRLHNLGYNITKKFIFNS